MKRKSSAYWKKRTDEIMAYVDRTDIDFFDELQKIYTEGRQNVQKEIYAFYAQYAKDNQITMQEAQKQLRREDLSDYRANAEKYFKQAEKDPDLLKRLNEQYRAGKVTRLEALELNLEWQLGKMNQTLQKSFNSYLKETAQHVYKKISGGNSSSTLNRPALEQLVKTPFNGKNYSSSLWGNTDTLADGLKQTLKNGFIRGQGPADMARELRKKYNVARSRSEAIIRTDGTNIINNAAAKRYMEFGLTKYKILVHLDNRTTDICKKIKADDETFLFEEYQPGETAPPFHVNCRSGIVPDDSELGYEEEEEESEDGVTEQQIKDASDSLRKNNAIKQHLQEELDLEKEIEELSKTPKNIDYKKEHRRLREALEEQYDDGEIDDDEYNAGLAELRERFKRSNLTGDMKDNSDKMIRLKNQLLELQESNAIKNADIIKSELAKYREMGIPSDVDMKKHLTKPNSRASKMIAKAYDYYPTHWVRKSAEHGIIDVGTAKRGYYSAGFKELRLSGANGKRNSFRTALHELGHRMEDVDKTILERERQFYEYRTKGETLQSLKKLKGGNYKENEMTRVDNFLNPYMGKDYGGSSYEVLTMGIDTLYTRPTELMKDPEMFEWVVGMLLK